MHLRNSRSLGRKFGNWRKCTIMCDAECVSIGHLGIHFELYYFSKSKEMWKLVAFEIIQKNFSFVIFFKNIFLSNQIIAHTYLLLKGHLCAWHITFWKLMLQFLKHVFYTCSLSHGDKYKWMDIYEINVTIAPHLKINFCSNSHLFSKNILVPWDFERQTEAYALFFADFGELFDLDSWSLITNHIPYTEPVHFYYLPHAYDVLHGNAGNRDVLGIQ